MKPGLIVPKKELVNLDFSYSKYFGAVSELPSEDFIVAEPLEVKDQGDDFTCTAQAVTSVSEDQEGVILNSSYTWDKIKKLGGSDERGAPPRLACRVATKYGFLEKGAIEDSDQAKKHRKEAYFKVDGQKDLFDSILATMWKHRNEKRSVYVGTYWQPLWDMISGGIIPKGLPMNKLNPHAFKAYGMKTIDGEPHLIALNSYGTDIGDNGRFYFPREVVNKFVFAYTFQDASPDDVKRSWNILQKIKYIVVKILAKFK